MKALSVAALASTFLFALTTFTHAAIVNVSAGYSETQVGGITSTVVDGLWSRSDYWWHHGDYPRIIALDRLITEADPNFLEPYSNGGWLMDSLGDTKDAERYYRLGAERNPDKSYLWFSLGFFYYNSMKDYPDAIMTFKRAADAPDGGPKSLKMLAHSYERNNQLGEAVNIWQSLHTKYPGDAVILLNLNKDQNLLRTANPTVSQ